MAKMKTFADEAKLIRSKYYKDREPGEDKFTDDSFNAEMKALMQAQEAIKQEQNIEEIQSPQFANQELKNGGNLPKYDGFSTETNFLQNTAGPRSGGLSMNTYDPNTISRMNPIDAYVNMDINQPLDFTKTRTPNVYSGESVANMTQDGKLNNLFSGGGGGEFTPTANALIPLLTTAGNAISSKILADAAEKRRKSLLEGIDVRLGRISPQQIDLGRERADIRSQAAQTEAGGRYLARGARSASEAANIATMARIFGSRVAGSALTKSLQEESIKKAAFIAEANRMNLDLANREKLMEAQQRMAIEQQYGDVPDQLKAQFAQTTSQSLANYLAENQRMRRDYDFMRMAQPDMTMSYQQNYEGLTPWQQRMARLGIRNVTPDVSVRS